MFYLLISNASSRGSVFKIQDVTNRDHGNQSKLIFFFFLLCPLFNREASCQVIRDVAHIVILMNGRREDSRGLKIRHKLGSHPTKKQSEFSSFPHLLRTSSALKTLRVALLQSLAECNRYTFATHGCSANITIRLLTQRLL